MTQVDSAGTSSQEEAVQNQFIRAIPDIILDKTLPDRAWLAYCRLEQVAKSSRLVLHYHTRLNMPAEQAIAALADLSNSHPTCYRLDGHRLTLQAPPDRFVKLPWSIIDADIPTWQKRVITAILYQLYESTRHKGVGRISVSKLNDTCRIPARSKNDRKSLIRGIIDGMAQRGMIEILSQRPGACTACRLTWGATWGANTDAAATRTPGSPDAAPQVETDSHPRFAEVAPHPWGQKPEEETPERNQQPRNRGEPTQAPAGGEPLERRGSQQQTETTDPDDTPRKPKTWELIEQSAPCKSTDSPGELAELWRDRRSAILATYRETGTEPNPEAIISDTLQIMAKVFSNRLSLGALLGPRWDRFRQALERWLAGAESRAWEHLPYLLAAVGNLSALPDAAVVAAWERTTGYVVPCPPVATLRKLAITNQE